MEPIVANKCYSCGKVFRDESDFNRHKNRKTPCLIREIDEKNLKHPNRCIYCNMILSKPSNLARHHASCKVKNGGMNMLFDKVKYEETLRILKEEREIEKAERIREREEMRKEIEEMKNEMKKEIDELRKNNAGVTNNINTGTVINGDLNNNVNIIINNFTSPNVSHLLEFDTFRKMLGTFDIDLPIEIILNVYFDPSHPENASIHLLDKETKHVLAMVDGRWNAFTMEKIVGLLREVGYRCAAEGVKIHGSNDQYPDRVKYIAGKAEVTNRFQHELTDPKTIKYDSGKIEDKLMSEFIVSSKHPAVIAENQRRKKEIAAAKKL
jgi:hypothetical protein